MPCLVKVILRGCARSLCNEVFCFDFALRDCAGLFNGFPRVNPGLNEQMSSLPDAAASGGGIGRPKACAACRKLKVGFLMCTVGREADVRRYSLDVTPISSTTARARDVEG